MKIKAKPHRLTVCCFIFGMMLLLLPLCEVNCQNYIAYSVQINSDGSAFWKITNFSDVNASVGTFSGFQDKVSSLIESSSNLTHREMTVDENSLQINTTISSESKTTEYSFLWQNFSLIQGHQLIFGDVFQVNDFFTQLYGDAALQMIYPSSFSVKSITPAPYQSDDSAKTLGWARTQDLVSGQTHIVLTSTDMNDNSSQIGWQQFAVIGVVVVGVALFLAGFYLFRHRKTSNKSASIAIPVVSEELETEEGKILKLLKSYGGTMRQSDIVEQSRFSKAKTSQLLTLLEKNGDITRYKKGRDKIVNLTKRVEK
jgi:uncharacterized membrane protein